MERKSNEELFEEISQKEQDIYLQKARYLLEYNYVEDREIEELAIEMFGKRRVKTS